MAQARDGASRYAFTQARGSAAERERLALLQALRDAQTTRCLDVVGVGAGWRCLDVGAGAGSLACWLSERVGPSGRVVATDVETAAIAHLDAPNLDVIRHDILVDDLPRETFDLVHSRFVLIHLPDRDEALARIVAAARPGGWVVVGDQDLRAVAPARPSEVFRRGWAAYLATMTSTGADIGYGQRIPAVLEGHGLREVQANGESTY
ncbi:MAG: methyltransferase domain-containing protein [Actinomycetota bacterium]